ncbi:MAG: DNA-deoxyinosine glycosylase [Bacillota bacterium]|nr:DNA-deoxyinosine glycosylase [Bacillota bacterium]
MAQTETVTHELEPYYNENSKVLILGSIPSPKSREQGFYYGHPRNRFWKVLSDILKEEFPDTVEKRKAMLEAHNIALWDVLSSCEIKGADDSSIRNPHANDLGIIINKANISAVFATGKKAADLYNRYCRSSSGIDVICLPSTSPANCSCSYERLKQEYSIILNYL